MRPFKWLMHFSVIWLVVAMGSQYLIMLLGIYGLGFADYEAFTKWIFETRLYAQVFVVVTAFLMYVLPVLLFRFVDKGMLLRNFNATKIPAFTLILLAVGGVVCSIPFNMTVFEFNQSLPIPESWLSGEERVKSIIDTLFAMHGIQDLIMALFVGALVPAFTEEFFFRGGLQPLLQKVFRNADVGIIAAAIVFSAFHGQALGFIPRIILGLMFGYIYYWGRSIWLPILAHFIWNSWQFVGMYIVSKQPEEVVGTDETTIPLWMSLISVALLFLIFKQFYTRAIVLKEAWR